MADGRLAVAAGLALRLLLCVQLRHIGGAEVDRVEKQGREPEILHGFRHDLPCEREQKARAFDQKERPKSIFGDVPETEQAAVGQIDDEVRAVVGLGSHLDLQSDFVDVVANLFGVEAELHVQRRLDLPLEYLWRRRTLG